MLIDIPVVIEFDCVDTNRAFTTKRIFTLRFDVDDDNIPAQYALTYPPRSGTFFADEYGIMFDLMTAGTYEKIVKEARRNPIDYCADEAEGERLQAVLNDEKDPTP